MITEIKQSFRIWIGCLGSYNAGHLVGRWADLEKDSLKDIHEEIKGECLEVSKMDNEKFPNCWKCEELEVMDTDGTKEFAEFIRSLGTIEQMFQVFRSVKSLMFEDGYKDELLTERLQAYFIYITDNIGYKISNDDYEIDGFNDSFLGIWETWESFGDDCLSDIGDHVCSCSNSDCNYFNYKSYYADLKYDYHLSEMPDNKGVYIFRNN